MIRWDDYSEDARAVGLAYCAWLALYLLFRHVALRQLSSDGANRSVSIVHAAVGIVLPVIACDVSDVKGRVGSAATPLQLAAMRVSGAYFVYDTLCCLAVELCEGRVDLANTFHHVMTVAGMAAGMAARRSGHELLLCLMLMEVSSPCLHLRHLLRETGRGGTALAEVNDVAFAVAFLLCRNVVGAPLVWWTVMSEKPPVLVKAGALGILLVSWFWTGKLISMIMRKVRRRPGVKTD